MATDSSRYCPRCLNTFEGNPDKCSNLACGRVRPPDGWGALFHPGDVLDRHYLIERALAVGGAGLTYLARELDSGGAPMGPKLAIKVLYQQRDSGGFLRRLANEAQILQELAHENIVECRGFVHRTGRAPYLVTLFEHGGNLGSHLETHGALSPQVAAGILRQVLLALDTAHQRAIVHRDLKPENVLLRQRVVRQAIPRVRVADFGIAKVDAIGDRLTRQGAFLGTPEFAAPEQFSAQTLTPATDVFAAGALLYALITDEAVVAYSDRLDAGECLHELLAAVPPAVPESVGEEPERALLQRVLDGMMQVIPERRWTIQQCLVALDGLESGRPRQTLQTLELTATPDDRHDTWLDDAKEEEDAVEAEPAVERGGMVGTLVGVVGPLLTVVVGLPIVLAILAGVAFGAGWFAGPPTIADAELQPPITVQVPATAAPLRDLSSPSNPAEIDERDRLTRALAGQAKGIQKACQLADALVADVRISERGRVRSVDIQGALPPDQQRCVTRQLRRARLARSSTGDVGMRISVSFGAQ